MPRESALLRAKLELVLPALRTAGWRLLNHEDVRRLYPEYLFLTHCVIRASVPLLEAGRDRARALPDDATARALEEYLGRHVEEERGHDEWLLEDLTTTGFPVGDVRTRPPSPTVAALVGSQYYWLHHAHPVALLGYVALLEGYPPVPEEVEQLRDRTGYPAEAFRTLLLHAEVDQRHGSELDEVLDCLPLTPQQRALVGLSAIASVRHLAAAVDELVESVPAG